MTATLACHVGVAYGADSLANSPTFTDVSSYVTGFSTRRGRQYLTDRTEAGTADVRFVDTDGKLDPTNSAGTFYPMDPNAPARIQLRNAFTGSYVTIFRGLIQGCPQTIRADGAPIDRGSIPLADLFSLLALKELPPGVDFDVLASPGTYPAGAPPQGTNTTGNITYAEQTVQDRMYAILADVGFPSGLLNIFDAGARAQQMTYSPGYTALAALQDTADAEFPGVANIFVDKAGILSFRGRLSRSDTGGGNPYGVNTWQCGDTAAVSGDSSLASLAHGDFVIDRDVAKVINNALFTPQGIADADIAGQLVVDSTSITQFGPRAITGANLITAGATAGPYAGDPLGETLMFGQFYVDNFKAAHTRIVQATFRPVPAGAANASAHWNLMCNAEIGDILEVTVTFPHGDGFTAEDYFIEGISYELQAAGDNPDVTMTLDLSPTYSTFPTGWDPNA